MAIIIDGIILGIPKSIITFAAVNSSDSGGGFYSTRLDASIVLIGVIFTVIDVAYFAILNGGDKGQTVGQMALGITVRDESTGGPIGPQRAGVRILALEPGLIFSWIPVLGVIAGLYTLVAALSPLWDSRRQGFHDKVAKTVVIKTR